MKLKADESRREGNVFQRTAAEFRRNGVYYRWRQKGYIPEDSSRIANANQGFVYGSDKDGAAQLNAVISEYCNQLKKGPVSYDSVRSVYSTALRDAGIQRVIGERQIQLNAFLAR
jgi:hypothetical protein